ncbi:MAG: nucleotide kinase, partial [Oscillospiraceae bacterium]|nr:nucleotide kinase [Oscillospiraceae bacterium]
SVHMLPVDKKEMPTEENLLFYRGEKRAYEQNALRFNAIGCRCLADLEWAELIVMDELGPAESAAAAFQDRVLALLDGEIPVLGVLQEGESAFQRQVATHPNVELIYVTKENRDSLS